MKPRKILDIAREKGLNAIVINDHNTIKGGLEAKQINPYPNLEVIVGAEIKTDAGDVTGIFLTREIESYKFTDVAREIKSQGGLVILNHPYVDHNLDLIDYSLIDFIEGYNSRLTDKQNSKAIYLAKEKKKILSAGSDAHIYDDIGKCYSEYQDSELLKPFSIHYNRCSIWSIPKSQLLKAIKNKDSALFMKLLIYIPKYMIMFGKKFNTEEHDHIIS
jgi:hypothetical protein